MATGLKVLLYLAGALLVVHFVFLFALAERASGLAIVTALLAVTLATPWVRRRLADRAFIGWTWVQHSTFFVLMILATVWLERGDRVEVIRADYAFTGMTVLTGQPGAEPIEDGVVLVGRDGQIRAVGNRASVAIPAGYQEIALAGHTLMPGLINAHGHLILPGRDRDEGVDGAPVIGMPRWVGNLLGEFLDSYPGRRLALWQMNRSVNRALAGGVTTLRGLGDPGYYDVALRNQIQQGKRFGPRLLVAGRLLCTTGGHAHQIGLIFDGPVGARRAVRTALFQGVDVIKIASTGGVADSRRIGEAGELQMTPAEIAAVVDEAHRKHYLVAAHVESAAGVLDALRAGADTIEHGAELDDEAITLFKDNPNALRGYSTLHPTLSVIAGERVLTDEIRADPIRFVIHQNGNDIKRRMIIGYKQAVAAGVHIAVGTDAGLVDHASVWKELGEMQAIGGISNEDAIYIGTLATAQSIGVDQLTGSIEAGKAADLLIVAGNPLEDIAALDDPIMVVANGVIAVRP